MEPGSLAAHLANGTLNTLAQAECVSNRPWTPHPKFAGVYLKLLVAGADTDNRLSCHIVKIDPGAALSEHVHAGQWELHEVIEGEGVARLAEREFPYHPGQMTVIPQGISHQVVAGENGLVLLAKFFPAQG